jgi:hypothetical protein
MVRQTNMKDLASSDSNEALRLIGHEEFAVFQCRNPEPHIG